MGSNTLKVTVMTQELLARGDMAAVPCTALLDSGASHSFVSRAVATQAGHILALPTPMVFTLADGRKLRVQDSVILSLDVGGVLVTDVFMVHPESGDIDDMILGASTMRKYGLKLDFEHGAILSTLTADDAPPLRSATVTRKETAMHEVLRRLFARLGYEKIPDELTDDDAINMICERASRGYKAVLSELALTDTASEADALKAIRSLKQPALPLAEPKTPAPDARPFLKVLLPELGLSLSEDLTEEQAKELIVKAMKKPAPATAVAAKGVLTVLELADTSTEEEVVGRILALKNPGSIVTVQQHEQLKEQLHAKKLDDIIKGSIAEGKMYPHEDPSWRDTVKKLDEAGLDGLKVLEESMKARHKLMPIGERLPMQTKQDAGVDDATLAVARQMGVSVETLRKHAQ